MRRSLIAALVVALALLVACNNPTTPATGDGSLAKMSTGSAYFLKGSSSAAKGARAATGSTALCAVSSTGTISAVTFTDASGNSESVAVDNAISLSTGGLALGLTYKSEALAYLADASGNLTALTPVPDGWDYARDDGTSLYYVSGGALYKAPIATGVGVQFSKAGETVATDAWLKVTASGGVVVIPPSSSTQTYYASSGAAGVTDSISLPDPVTYNSIEALDGTVYFVNHSGADVITAAYTEGPIPGRYQGATPETLCTLPATPTEADVRLSSKRSAHELVLGTDAGIVRIVATSSGLSYSVTAFPSGLLSYIGDTGSYTVSDGASVYFACHENGNWSNFDVTRYHIWAIPTGTLMASAAKSITTDTAGELVQDYNVSSLVAVGGRIFYQRNTGTGVQTMVYDGTSASVYADGAVSIEAVL